jgi:hypothetical protein
MKWPLAAACTRAGIADALATITPTLLTPGRGGPPAAVLGQLVVVANRHEGFAGRNIDVAVFYPEDDDYLIDRETTVTHYDVARIL